MLQYQHNHPPQNHHTSKYNIDCALAPNNRVPPTSGIFIPHSIAHVPLIYYNSSYSSMITTFHTCIIQSLVKNKRMILYALKILSSGKLASQWDRPISTGCWYPYENYKWEHLLYTKNSEVPSGTKITYANPLCDYHLHKDFPYCIRLTIGGDKFSYLSESHSPAATLLEEKIIFNRVISTPGYPFICADIKDFFLLSPMECFEYIKIHFRWITE